MIYIQYHIHIIIISYIITYHMISYDIIFWLVVWNMACMTFHSVGNLIIPTDEVIFFRGVGQPPTRVRMVVNSGYPLVNIRKTMKHHHVEWVNQLFLWPYYHHIILLSYHMAISYQYHSINIIYGHNIILLSYHII